MEQPSSPSRPLSPEELSAIALGAGAEPMSFVDLYLRVNGRVARRTFWLHGVLALLVAGLIFNAVLDIAGITGDNVDRLVNLVLIWPLLAIAAKRIHDFDRSGWWVLLHFVPVVGSLALIVVLGCMPGTHGANRFGTDPLRRPADPALNSGH